MNNVKIGKMVIGSVQTNCYFLYREGNAKVVVVDPADRGDYIYEKLTEKGFQVEAILLTHGHFDHIWGVKKLKDLTGAKVYAYEKERDVLDSVELNASEMAGRACTVEADVYGKDGEEWQLADITVRLIGTPGHTHGCCCYYVEEADILVCGDTLFEGSVGRTDLPTGSMGELVRSIKDKLFVLPDKTICFPGHGGSTTIGDEKMYNPFIQ